MKLTNKTHKKNRKSKIQNKVKTDVKIIHLKLWKILKIINLNSFTQWN